MSTETESEVDSVVQRFRAGQRIRIETASPGALKFRHPDGSVIGEPYHGNVGVVRTVHPPGYWDARRIYVELDRFPGAIHCFRPENVAHDE